MDRPLLGRYQLFDEMTAGRPVTAHDVVLSREVHVVLLPVGDGTATQALRRLRAAAATDRDDVPRILDLAVVDGCPVAVLMVGDGPSNLDTLIAVSCGAPTTAVPVGLPLAADGAHLVSAPSLSVRVGGPSARPAWLRVRDHRPALAVGLTVLGVMVVSLAARHTAPAPAPEPAPAPVASGSASQRPEAAALDAARTGAAAPTAVPSPDEQVVLLLAVVRDDPTAGPAAPGLLRLLRGLDASSGSERLALAGRAAVTARQAGQDGRLRQDLADRALAVMGAVQNG